MVHGPSRTSAWAGDERHGGWRRHLAHGDADPDGSVWLAQRLCDLRRRGPAGRDSIAAVISQGAFNSRSSLNRARGGEQADGLTRSEALRGSLLWLLLSAFFIVSMSIHACMIHFPRC